ncbi:MAG: hypothetical protein KDD84_24680, partial [Caldilineaceae bacterium]|nr:hypothetical protein [Caldilineaceae bacterium]
MAGRFVHLLILLIAVVMLTISTAPPIVTAQEGTLTPTEQLGKSIFFDTTLSLNRNQSCASCHGPQAGWTGPDEMINSWGAVYEGSIAGRFGDRKPPSAAYATQSPVFFRDKKGDFVGGNFWDGRATGEILGSPAADQAMGPFLNPMEQALPTAAEVVYRVCQAGYSVLFRETWGNDICDISNIDSAFGAIAISIAYYESSSEVNAFTAKYDYTFKGMAKLSKEEQLGYALFRGKAGCHRCHISNGQAALFTDYTYDNLGLPQNPANP